MILSIILTILKILGIILIAIVGLLLAIILLVVFVPIRYKAAVARTGIIDDPPVQAKGYVSWLLHIIHVSFGYPGEVICKVRLFGIPIIRIPDSKRNNNEKSLKKITKEKSSKEKEKKEKSSNENNNGEEVSKDNENESIDLTVNSNEDHSTNDSQDFFEDLEEDTEDSTDNTVSFWEKITTFVNKVKCTIVSCCDKIKAVFSNINNAKKNVHYYHTILTSDLFERTFEKTRKKLLRLLKEILPRKFEISLEVGFDDPYTTGELLAIAGIMYPIFGEHLIVLGNFEESVIRGAGRLKGRIFVFSFIKIGLYYLFDRDLKRLIRLFKKEEKKRGRK